MQVGAVVRHKTFAMLIGKVIEANTNGVLVQWDHEPDKKELFDETAAASAIEVVEKCGQCDKWRALHGPCIKGHFVPIFGKEDEVLGDGLNLENERQDRFVGCLLWGMIGDALGSPFEGHGQRKIRGWFDGGLPRLFIAGTQMGAREYGARYAMYTDDTNSTLALGEALTSGVVDAEIIAKSYSAFYNHPPQRGYPDSAKLVLKQVGEGADIRSTAIGSFPFGSFANGAAMRISPFGLLASGLPLKELRGMCAECCVSSHVHPDAIDSAFLQAMSVAHCLGLNSPQDFDGQELLRFLSPLVETQPMRRRLTLLQEHLAKGSEDSVLASFTEAGFQLYGPDAVATALWFTCKYAKNGPAEAVMQCVAWGGDCDTTGQMVGAIVGALWGTRHIPLRWFIPLENGEWGRDYAVSLGKRLAAVQVPLKCVDQEFVQGPFCNLLEKALVELRAYLKVEPEDDILDAYKKMRAPLPKTLWDKLFDAVSTNGVVRFDVAASLTAFAQRSPVDPRFFKSRKGFSRKEWSDLHKD